MTAIDVVIGQTLADKLTIQIIANQPCCCQRQPGFHPGQRAQHIRYSTTGCTFTFQYGGQATLFRPVIYQVHMVD